MPATLELPTPEIQKEAQAALRELSSPGSSPADKVLVRVSPEGRGREHNAVVPRQAFELFLEVLGQLANGNAVTIIPIGAELTTQQAADLLNVSRPHLVGMLERNELAFRPGRQTPAHRGSGCAPVQEARGAAAAGDHGRAHGRTRSWSWGTDRVAFIVVYDACVLHSAPVRDLLVRIANTGVVRARWSERILDECFASILERRPDLPASASRA